MAAGVSHFVLGWSVAIFWFGCVADASPKFCVDNSAFAYTYNEAILESPNYPDGYANNMSCHLSINTGSIDLCVKIHVIHSDLERSRNCKYDRLSFYRGESVDQGTILWKTCGHHRESQPITFSSPAITVHFKSDLSVVGRGFKLKYSATLCQGQLLDISSPVTTTASSSYKSPSGLEFTPQLAVQPDTGYMWSTSFISNKEPNPWFSLKFGSVTTIFNLRLGVRTVGGGYLPAEFNLAGMDKLSVYVSNSSTLESSGKQRCGSPWNYAHTNNILLHCGRNLKGQFLHITVPSASPTYLMICFIVLNRENGPTSSLNMIDAKATVVSSGSDSRQPAVLVLDGISTSCSSFTGVAKTWLRVDIQTILYIRQVRLLFGGNSYSGAGVDVYIGRGLRNNGLHENLRCHSVLSVVTRFQWMKYTCQQPAISQYIYIQKWGSSMEICEIAAFYDNILNMYSPVNITASDQFAPSNSIWKPVDGVHGTLTEASWKSLPFSKSWWRMEIPHRSTIVGVVIYLPSSPEREKMDGFAVYVGDSPVGNGSSNALCSEPWRGTISTVITISCTKLPVGKYLYVSAADRPGATLVLSEISVFTCQEPSAVITKKVFPDLHYTILTCQGTKSGCTVTKAVWVRPDGKAISTELEYTMNNRPMSSLTIDSNHYRTPYTCKISYAGGYATKVYPEPCACNGFGVYSSFYGRECSYDSGICNCNTSANVEGDHCDICQEGFRNKDGGKESGSDGCPLAASHVPVSDAQTVFSDIALNPRGQRTVALNVTGLNVFALDAPVGVVSSDGVSFSVSYYQISGDGLPDFVTPLGVLNMSAVSSDSGSEFEMFGRTFDENVKVTADPVRSTTGEVVYPYLYDSRTRSLEATGLSANPANAGTGLQFFSTSLTQVVLLSVTRLNLSQWVVSGALDTGFTPLRNGWPRLTDSLWPAYNGMSIFARWFFIRQDRSLEDSSRDWSVDTLDRLLTLLQVRSSKMPPRPVGLSDAETVRILVHALQVSHSPQLLWMERESGNALLPGHAVLVYKYRGNEFTFYDPEFGEEEQILSYDSSTAMFKPYYNGGFNRFYVYSHQAFQLKETDMETVYNLALKAFNDTTAPDIILDPFDEYITSNSLTVSGRVVPKPGHPMPAVLFSFLFSNDSESRSISRGRAIIDASGYFTKDVVDVGRGVSKIVFVAGGYAPSEQRLGKRSTISAIFQTIASLFFHSGYVQQPLYSTATPNLLTVTLTWDDGNSDLDLHILEPEGRHIYFANKGGSNTPFLDYDNTVGFGPEHYFINNGVQAASGSLEGKYKIRVHYYGSGLPELVRSIRWTIHVEGSTQESTPPITGVLSFDNYATNNEFHSSDSSWSPTYEATVQAVHFIAVAHSPVKLLYQKLFYHYSAQLWKNVLVLPRRQTEEKVSVLEEFNPDATKEGGVELLPKTSIDGCNYRAWLLRKYSLFLSPCWKNTDVALSYIHYKDENGTEFIPLYVDSEWSKVEAKWNVLIRQARKYPYAEQIGSSVSRFPQSIYCFVPTGDMNNSNTFIRWLFKSVSIEFIDMRRFHPGYKVPKDISSRFFQGQEFCSSDDSPPTVSGVECPANALTLPQFICF